MTTGKNIALTRWTFVGKVMSLLFNMLSRFVIAFFQGKLLFIAGQRQTISPWAEQRHFSLQSSRGAGSSRQAFEYDYNNKSKSKKQFPTWSQTWLPPCNILRWNVFLAFTPFSFHCCITSLLYMWILYRKYTQIILKRIWVISYYLSEPWCLHQQTHKHIQKKLLCKIMSQR